MAKLYIEPVCFTSYKTDPLMHADTFKYVGTFHLGHQVQLDFKSAAVRKL